jgi:hypothetical protein
MNLALVSDTDFDGIWHAPNCGSSLAFRARRFIPGWNHPRFQAGIVSAAKPELSSVLSWNRGPFKAGGKPGKPLFSKLTG